jgi:HEAT repeat protein
VIEALRAEAGVRRDAAEALGKIGTAAVAALTEALRDTDNILSGYADRALKSIRRR